MNTASRLVYAASALPTTSLLPQPMQWMASAHLSCDDAWSDLVPTLCATNVLLPTVRVHLHQDN